MAIIFRENQQYSVWNLIVFLVESVLESYRFLVESVWNLLFNFFYGIFYLIFLGIFYLIIF